MGLIAFYDGNNGAGNLVQAVSDNAGQNFKPTENDAIRSAVLYNVRTGCKIEVFDSPDGKTDDDYSVIIVNKTSCEYTVASFEKNDQNDNVSVTYQKDNGLDGKVSYIEIS